MKEKIFFCSSLIESRKQKNEGEFIQLVALSKVFCATSDLILCCEG